MRRAKWHWAATVIFILLFMVSCADRESVSIDLGGMFPYFEKESETRVIDFGIPTERDRKYLPKGWSAPKKRGKNVTYRWAIGDESVIGVYFNEVKDRSILIQCAPISGKDLSDEKKTVARGQQVARITINGTYLRTMNFFKIGDYRIEVPRELTQYGSNLISFRWKYKHTRIHSEEDLEGPAVRFYRLELLDNHSAVEPRPQESIDFRLEDDTLPTAVLPPGALMEYFFNIPQKAELKFGLSFHGDQKGAHVGLAVYGSEGGKFFRVFAKRHARRGKTVSIKLDRFAGQTVKLVFLNSIENSQGFRVSWINPLVFSKNGIPPLLETPISVSEKKDPSNPKQRIFPYNIFIYLVDTLRADHMSCYGYGKKTTPFVDEFAEEGILFRNCLANASWTKPTVGSLLTGLYPNRHGAEDRNEKISDDALFLFEILKPLGYTTVAITTNPTITKEFNFMQGADLYFSKPTWHGSSEYVNSVFASFLEENPDLKQKPIFAYVHPVDPHFPYTPSKAFRKFKKVDKERDRIRLKNIILRQLSGGPNEDDIDYMASLYDCEILQSDHYFKVFTDSLRKHGLYDDSIIIFTSDHGEQMFEHGGWNHGHSIYNEEIHVPLIVKLPGNKHAGIKPDFYVTQVDVLPTILEYIGEEPPSGIDGISIFDMMKSPDRRKDIFIKEKVDKHFFTGLVKVSSRKKYIYQYSDILSTDCFDNEMYDLIADTQEKRDLFTSETLFEIKSVKFRIESFLREMKRVSLRTEEINLEKIDPEIVRALKALGYIQ